MKKTTQPNDKDIPIVKQSLADHSTINKVADLKVNNTALNVTTQSEPDPDPSKVVQLTGSMAQLLETLIQFNVEQTGFSNSQMGELINASVNNSLISTTC